MMLVMMVVMIIMMKAIMIMMMMVMVFHCRILTHSPFNLVTKVCLSAGEDLANTC